VIHSEEGEGPHKRPVICFYTMSQEQLAHTLMPLGNLTKKRVRQIAQELKLAVAGKAESQEICFIPDNNYRRFLERNMPQVARPGQITNSRGKVLGEHRGIIHYTVGQRRGLGISAGEPLYVLAIGKELERPIAVEAKIRYLHKQAGAIVTPLGNGKTHVRFEQPQMAIAPGQAVVFYHGIW